MNKLLSFAAISAVAASADENLPSIKTNERRLDGITTDDLEKATRDFAQAHVGKIRAKEAALVSSNGGARRERLLRRNRRNGKGGKGSKDYGGRFDDDYDDDDTTFFDDDHPNAGRSNGGWYRGDDDWWSGSGKSGKSGSGKSGKGSWSNWSGSGDGGKWDGGGGWKGGHFPHEELFYMLPAACPNECISSYGSSSGEMVDSLKTCREEESQQWLIRSDGSYIMIESYDQPGKCIAVDFERGDDEKMVAMTCYNGELVLKDCHSDYGTEWYFTGGQLVNSFCWSAGLASTMAVYIEDSKNNDLTKVCGKDLAVWGAKEEALLKADTFMFVNRLPDAPFFILDVDEVLGGKEPPKPKAASIDSR